MSNKVFTASGALLIATLLAGCATTPTKKDFMSGSQSNEAVLRRTVAISLISATAKACGVKGGNEYREAFITAVRTKREVTPEFETKMRSWFESADTVVRENYSDPAELARLCERTAPTQTMIDSGINGIF